MTNALGFTRRLPTAALLCCWWQGYFTACARALLPCEGAVCALLHCGVNPQVRLLSSLPAARTTQPAEGLQAALFSKRGQWAAGQMVRLKQQQEQPPASSHPLPQQQLAPLFHLCTCTSDRLGLLLINPPHQLS